MFEYGQFDMYRDESVYSDPLLTALWAIPFFHGLPTSHLLVFSIKRLAKAKIKHGQFEIEYQWPGTVAEAGYKGARHLEKNTFYFGALLWALNEDFMRALLSSGNVG